MKQQTICALLALQSFFDHNTGVKDTREALRAILNDYAQLKGKDVRTLEDESDNFAACRAFLYALDHCGDFDEKMINGGGVSKSK